MSTHSATRRSTLRDFIMTNVMTAHTLTREEVGRYARGLKPLPPPTEKRTTGTRG